MDFSGYGVSATPAFYEILIHVPLLFSTSFHCCRRHPWAFRTSGPGGTGFDRLHGGVFPCSTIIPSGERVVFLAQWDSWKNCPSESEPTPFSRFCISSRGQLIPTVSTVYTAAFPMKCGMVWLKMGYTIYSPKLPSQKEKVWWTSGLNCQVPTLKYHEIVYCNSPSFDG